MSNWINWDEIFEEKMKDPAYREKFEIGYAEFSKKMDAELAAERTRSFFPRFKKRPKPTTQSLQHLHRQTYAT